MNRSIQNRPLDVIFSGESKNKVKGQTQIIHGIDEPIVPPRKINSISSSRTKNPLQKSTTLNASIGSTNSFREELRSTSKTSMSREFLMGSTTMNSSVKLPPSDHTFQKVINLINDKYSFDLYDRHFVEFQKVLANRDIGFFVDEKDDVTFLVNYCIDIILDGEKPVDAKEGCIKLLDMFVTICFNPLRERKASDSLVKSDSYLSIINSLGKIMKLTVPIVKPIQLIATRCLSEFIEKSFEIEYLQKAVKHSDILRDVLSTIVNLINENEKVESEMFLEAMSVILCLSRYSEYSEVLTMEGGLTVLVNVLNASEFNDAIVFKIVDTLWNVVEVFPKASLYLGDYSCVNSLFSILRDVNQKGFRTKDKELRNDILILFSFLSREPENQTILKDCGLLEYLAAVSIGLDLYPDAVSAQCSSLSSSSNEDFEMKKLSWSILFYLTSSDSCLPLIVELGFITLLLETINETGTVMNKWNENQKWELKIIALKVLFMLSVRVPEEFSKEEGARICLEVLQTTRDETILGGCYNTIMNISTTVIGSADLHNADIVPIMLDACVDPEVSLNSRTDAIRIIANVCSHIIESREAFKLNGGVTKSLTLLESCVRDYNQVEKDEFIFNSVDCVWSCVVGTEESEKIFIDGDGIHLLLTLLTLVNNWIKLSILGCLADFMNCSMQAIDEVLTWKGRRKENVVTYLIKLWKENESARDVKDRIFMENMELDPKNYDLQQKIYHVLNVTGNRIDPSLLSDDDSIELVKIQHYDKLLNDKAWEDICMELEQENIRPTTPDRELIAEKFKEKEERENNIALGKQDISNEMQNRILKDEEAFYSTIIDRNNHNASAMQKPFNNSTTPTHGLVDDRYTSKSRANAKASTAVKNISVQAFKIIGGYVNRRAAEEEI